MLEQNILIYNMARVCLSLGSNIGNRELYIRDALKLMDNEGIVKNTVVSRMLNTKALLKKGSPKSWDMDFLNCLLIGDTDFGAHALYDEVFKVEQIIGGAKTSWAPRKLDIDILLYGDLCLSTDKLTIPHSELLKREFLVELVSEIVPEMKYSGHGYFYNRNFQDIKERLYGSKNI
jgi:2-amino-4-hydroxy-6-hydroxymethyldihydropteridine diphosphokinase